MLSGILNGKKVGYAMVFEGVGKVLANKMSEKELGRLVDAACPGCGSCNGMFTANTMACVTEAMGMSLPGCATSLAVGALKQEVIRIETAVTELIRDMENSIGEADLFLKNFQ